MALTNQQVIAAMYKQHGKHLASLHHDFLPTCSEATINEAEKYYFKLWLNHGELRFWKLSGRVSISMQSTNL